MFINQFYDKGLAHASYGIIRAGKMVVIDPARNPQQYYDLATLHEAEIVGVIETHLHADFVSSHLEIHQTTGATVYISKLAGAEYPHQTFDDGDVIQLVDIKLKAINTPGHSPDSICILVEDENGKDTAIFTGDTLFVGDVGRPDLRESAGNIKAKKEELAHQMYHTTRHKLMTLAKDVTVYPAHGPGSLCGKNISADLQTTIGRELRENYALQLMEELNFVKLLIADQPFVPKYFGYDVETNKTGAPAFKPGIDAVKIVDSINAQDGALIIDTRPAVQFKKGHLPGAINLQDGEKFETWLGSIVGPDEQFYIIAASEYCINEVVAKAAKIGYEKNIIAASTALKGELIQDEEFTGDIVKDQNNYTIVDVRNTGETAKGKVFKNAITIPLPELRERVNEIPTDKPIVVHCAAGYRSAAASSIVEAAVTNVPVYDYGERIKELMVAGS
ncbi:MBL fold metallo-hydrolase [Mucilaginibacter sp. JRF]|uniref:rhodanese-like domain-containing protein n=1 Tax=Mucilaginibacter sp. JRF TaxID=2780088 RepID=UPI0018803FED|nr:rhodanese-like domain-containing protein [Mucilaginibacter sp. JRF]MBE9585067.1 MBL fold metallo-hydrolase [Mucilaginibacter sp. JRF]